MDKAKDIYIFFGLGDNHLKVVFESYLLTTFEFDMPPHFTLYFPPALFCHRKVWPLTVKDAVVHLIGNGTVLVHGLHSQDRGSL